MRFRIHRIRKLVGKVRYPLAISKIPHLIGNAYQFSSLVDTLVAAARRLDCQCRAANANAEDDLGSQLLSLWASASTKVKDVSTAYLPNKASVDAIKTSPSTSSSTSSASFSSFSKSSSQATKTPLTSRSYRRRLGLGVEGWVFVFVIVLVLISGRLCFNPKANKSKVN